MMDNFAPPPPAIRTHRITPELKAMKPGEHRLLDRKTAACLRSHGRYNGWTMVQRNEGENVRVWRLED